MLTIDLVLILITICIVIALISRSISRFSMGDKYIQKANELMLEAKKMQGYLARGQQLLKAAGLEGITQLQEMPGDMQGLLQQVVNNPKVLEELGVDAKILKNPLVQGFLSKYLEKNQSQNLNNQIGY